MNAHKYIYREVVAICHKRPRLWTGLVNSTARISPDFQWIETETKIKGLKDHNAWPWWAKLLRLLATKQDRGLGSTIERITRRLGIQFVKNALKINCHCDGRKLRLDARFPYILLLLMTASASIAQTRPNLSPLVTIPDTNTPPDTNAFNWEWDASPDSNLLTGYILAYTTNFPPTFDPGTYVSIYLGNVTSATIWTTNVDSYLFWTVFGYDGIGLTLPANIVAYPIQPPPHTNLVITLDAPRTNLWIELCTDITAGAFLGYTNITGSNVVLALTNLPATGYFDALATDTGPPPQLSIQLQ